MSDLEAKYEASYLELGRTKAALFYVREHRDRLMRQVLILEAELMKAGIDLPARIKRKQKARDE